MLWSANAVLGEQRCHGGPDMAQAPGEAIRAGGCAEHVAVVVQMTREAIAGLEERLHGRIGDLRGAGLRARAWRLATLGPGRADLNVIPAHVARGQQTDDVLVERNDIRVVGGELGIGSAGSPGANPNEVARPDGLAHGRVEGRATRRYSLDIRIGGRSARRRK